MLNDLHNNSDLENSMLYASKKMVVNNKILILFLISSIVKI